MATIFRRVLLVILASFLLWRIASYGICEYYLQQAEKGEESAVDRALAWNSRNPDARYRNAKALKDTDPAGSSEMLKRSFAEKPSSAFPLLALGDLAVNAGKPAQASALVDTASGLMPANPLVQIQVGAFWAKRGNLGAAMAHWSQALEASPKVSDQLFPILLKLAEEPQTVGIFQSVAASPPSWWEPFFKIAARRALDLEVVRTLYAFRRAAADAPLTRDERNDYIRRLRREGKITEAYLVWVNGLEDTEREHLGILYNGGFELELGNAGFEWHATGTHGVSVRTEKAVGAQGEKALHLVFKRREARYRHLFQPLFLDSGVYRVEGMVRTDSLKTQGGLKWTVRCLYPTRTPLGESERFLGSSEWRDFSFEVQVPEDCIAQEIRLDSAGRRAFEHKITGGVWFDAMSMRKVLSTSTEVASSVVKNTEPEDAGSGEAPGNADVPDMPTPGEPVSDPDAL